MTAENSVFPGVTDDAAKSLRESLGKMGNFSSMQNRTIIPRRNCPKKESSGFSVGGFEVECAAVTVMGESDVISAAFVFHFCPPFFASRLGPFTGVGKQCGAEHDRLLRTPGHSEHLCNAFENLIQKTHTVPTSHSKNQKNHYFFSVSRRYFVGN